MSRRLGSAAAIRRRAAEPKGPRPGPVLSRLSRSTTPPPSGLLRAGPSRSVPIALRPNATSWAILPAAAARLPRRLAYGRAAKPLLDKNVGRSSWNASGPAHSGPPVARASFASSAVHRPRRAERRAAPRPLRQDPRPSAWGRSRSQLSAGRSGARSGPVRAEARVRGSSHTKVNGGRSLACAASALCALPVASMLVPGYTNGSNGW